MLEDQSISRIFRIYLIISLAVHELPFCLIVGPILREILVQARANLERLKTMVPVARDKTKATHFLPGIFVIFQDCVRRLLLLFFFLVTDHYEELLCKFAFTEV